jgi:hypothetical protein
MSSDATEIINASCSVCGVEVRGEKVVWKGFAEGLLEKDRVKNLGALEGGHVCGDCSS